MKVLYTFGGIPHYLSAMLNKLCTKGVEITVVTPQKGNATIGKGVKMVEGGTYKHLTTEEKKMFYGKSAYPHCGHRTQRKARHTCHGLALLPANILSAQAPAGNERVQHPTGNPGDPLPNPTLWKNKRILPCQPDVRREYAPA